MSYKIQILIGSSSHNSHSLNLAKAVQKKLNLAGVTTELIDLIEYNLPQYDTSKEKEHILPIHK